MLGLHDGRHDVGRTASPSSAGRVAGSLPPLHGARLAVWRSAVCSSTPVHVHVHLYSFIHVHVPFIYVPDLCTSQILFISIDIEAKSKNVRQKIEKKNFVHEEK